MANITSSGLSATAALNAWAGAIAAFQPLLAAGLLLAGDIIALFKKAHPGATDAELNTILTALIVASDQERAEIARERAAALAELANPGQAG